MDFLAGEGVQHVGERGIALITERRRWFVVCDGLDAPPHVLSVICVLKVDFFGICILCLLDRLDQVHSCSYEGTLSPDLKAAS